MPAWSIDIVPGKELAIPQRLSRKISRPRRSGHYTRTLATWSVGTIRPLETIKFRCWARRS